MKNILILTVGLLVAFGAVGCKSKKEKVYEQQIEAIRKIFVANSLNAEEERKTGIGTNSKTGEIEILDLSGRNLTVLPPEIGLLTGRKELNVSGNKLTELPQEIGDLKKLKKLDVSENELTKLPSTIGDLARLESLHIHSNDIVFLPSSFGRLRSLNDLILFNNKLTAFPDSLHGLEELEFISLTGNMFRVFPKTLTQIPNIGSISADYGSIDTSSLPDGVRMKPDGFFVFENH
ncbi:MAG: hypothetical protein GF344_04175 [Chitinivibrionales bacterium]|nr:hypothetical protein [Chitinivibrionales bacterium]